VLCDVVCCVCLPNLSPFFFSSLLFSVHFGLDWIGFGLRLCLVHMIYIPST
jgi:hypothetical protein